jgi:tetratricopeptide repeat protein 8
MSPSCCDGCQDGNMQKALELAGHATAQQGSNDWWWQERQGKAFYQLGLLRDADKHFAAAADLQVGCAPAVNLHH